MNVNTSQMTICLCPVHGGKIKQTRVPLGGTILNLNVSLNMCSVRGLSPRLTTPLTMYAGILKAQDGGRLKSSSRSVAKKVLSQLWSGQATLSNRVANGVLVVIVLSFLRNFTED